MLNRSKPLIWLPRPALKPQEAISLQPYTKQLNELLDAQQKRELLLALWHVAHSDGQVDGREEYTIRKICGLLNLRHRDFIQAKLKSL